VEIALYRIAQEALQNVVKHSGAGHAELELRCDGGEAILRVADDGDGFDQAALAGSASGERSYGMRSMTERAELVGGRIDVTSRPGLGTAVTAVVPLRAGSDGYASA
jgi:signal transduction histidine kinase